MKKSFTLIELLIVLLILSLIIGIVVPKGIKFYNAFMKKINTKHVNDKKVKIQINCFITNENNKTMHVNKNGIIYEKKLYNN